MISDIFLGLCWHPNCSIFISYSIIGATMKTNKIVLIFPLLAAGLILFFSGCYTRVATDDENGTTYWDRNQDTTYQSQNNNYDETGRYGDHVYLGFEYYTPSPYYGYDSWSYNGYYNSPWNYSSWYYGAAFMGYPFLYYPYYPSPYYYPHHHGYYGGYASYGGYGSYANAGGYGGARNSGYTRRGSLPGLFDNTGRGTSGTGGAYVASPGSGYSIPTRSGSQPSGTVAGSSNRSERSSTVNPGSNAIPSRGNTVRVIPNGTSAPARGQSTGSQQQGVSYGAGRSGNTRSGGGSRHDGGSRPAYVPSYTPSRASAPHYSPPPSNSGRSGGSDNRSSGGSRGRGR
jgi:hypothetical protein